MDKKNIKLPNDKRMLFILIGAIAAACVLFFVGKSIYTGVIAKNQEIEQLKLQNDQLQLANEYQSLNAEFEQYEHRAQALANDSISEKYEAAKNKVERLLDELNNEKVKSQARISELQNEIRTLRALMRHYIQQIDSLGRENAGLRAENQEIKTRNRQLSTQVQQQTDRNRELTERVTLAEKLNVTGLKLEGLKKNGKVERNITKAKQLVVTFTIPQNNSTPVGEKTIYLRIVSPEGNLLGDAGTFPFENGHVEATARKTVEYQGEELTNIHIYWDVNTVLNPGSYTVELFADNFRLISRQFTMNK